MAIFPNEIDYNSLTVISEDGSEGYDILYHFGLLPVNGQYIFDSPKKKTTYVDIPGASGSLDFTNALVPWDNYSDIEGDIDFYMLESTDINSTLISPDLDNNINNRKKLVLNSFCKKTWKIYPNDLEEPNEFYYKGRFELKTIKTNKLNHTIFTISYRFNPYMEHSTTSAMTTINTVDFAPVSDSFMNTLDYKSFEGPCAFTGWMLQISKDSHAELQIYNSYLAKETRIVWENGAILNPGELSTAVLYCPNDLYGLYINTRSYKLSDPTVSGGGRLRMTFNGAYLQPYRKMM